MSLNEIKLTAPLLSGLYAQVLVEKQPDHNPFGAGLKDNTSVPEKKSSLTVPVQKSETIRFLGKNTKKVLVVVKNETLPFLEDASLNQLTSILSACSLSLADVAIINWAQVPVRDCQYIFETLNNPQVLLFGVTPLEFGLPADFPLFQVQTLAGRTYISAPAITELIATKEHKIKLWTSLKTMFGI